MTGIEAPPNSEPPPVSRTRGWVLVVSVAFVAAWSILGFFGRGRSIIAVQPGGALFDDRVLPVFFVAFLASAIISWRWPLIGGVVGVFTVAGFVPFALHQLETWSAIVMIGAYGTAVLAWLAIGLRERTTVTDAVPGSEPAEPDGLDMGRRQVLFTIAGAAVAVVAGSSIGRYVYDQIWGPTHPESDLAALSDSAVEWMWCGAVTATGCTVRVRPNQRFDNAALLVGTDPELADPQRVPMDQLYDRVAGFVVRELDADTQYWYALEIDGDADRVGTGTFRTFPVTARPLRLAFGSCARTGSNGAVFDAIRLADPDVYVCLGDFHYGDVFVDDVDDYRQVFDVQLSQPAQAALYRTVPIAYVWDDHDYGPNDSNRLAPGRNAAMVAYREYVPHYDLDGPDSAIFQAFTIGTVRVILTDARSARDAHSGFVGPEKTMLGDRQREWLLDELVNSAPDHDLLIWVNPVPWVDEAEPDADTWAGYAVERALIAEHIAANRIDHLVMVSGDAHMVAIDDGTHTDYSSEAGHGFPLLHVAALDRPGGIKGGPYTKGPIPGGGHFGVVEVEVTASGVDVALVAKDWRGDDLLRSEFTLPRR